MAKVISLYLARSIVDLRHYLGSRRQHKQSVTLEQLQTSCDEIENNARQHLVGEGDQELAFLTYSRALEYLNLIRHCKEYSQQSRTFQERYEKRQTDCEQVLFALQIDLEQRYGESISVDRDIEEESVNNSTSNEYRANTPMKYIFSTERQLPSNRIQREQTPMSLYAPLHMPAMHSQNRQRFEERLTTTRPSIFPQTDHHTQTSELPSTQSRIDVPPRSFCRFIKSRSRQCAVCLDEKPITDFNEVFSTACQHDQRQICTDCVREHIQQIVNDRSTSVVRCPEEACDACFDFDTIRKILVGLKTPVSQFEDRLSMEYVERMKNFVWCAHGCGWACQLDISGGPTFTCRRCKEKTCGHHRVKWHARMTCTEYDQKLNSNREEMENQNWLKNHTKQCPECNAPIEKNEGCDHMTCRRCKHEFCWVCLADWKSILDYGNQHHARDCQYYLKT